MSEGDGTFIVVKAARVLGGALTAYGLGCHFTYMRMRRTLQPRKIQETTYPSLEVEQVNMLRTLILLKLFIFLAEFIMLIPMYTYTTSGSIYFWLQIQKALKSLCPLNLFHSPLVGIEAEFD
jgi:uncharacterized membrane protein